MDNNIDYITRSEGLCNICGRSYLVNVVPRFARFTCCEDCFQKVTDDNKQWINQITAIFNELQKAEKTGKIETVFSNKRCQKKKIICTDILYGQIGKYWKKFNN